MVYPANFENKIGFDKIRLLVNEKCLSPMGKERVEQMHFSACLPTISAQLTLVGEFVGILHGDRPFPVSFFIDVRYSLQRIHPENTFLDEKELFDLKRSLQTMLDICRFFRPAGEDKAKLYPAPLPGKQVVSSNKYDDKVIHYPALTKLVGDIPVFPDLIKKIDAILDKFGYIKDHASPDLARIRKEIQSVTSSISRTLQNILRTAQSEGLVDKDVAPTMRDGRLVIPVAPTFKRKLRGIVHDESATGKTVFIEPEAVVEANNRIRELESMERREIIRILTLFTDEVRPLVPELLNAYGLMGEIDFIRAKALFAGQIHAIKPEVDAKPRLDWTGAVHPLLYLALEKQNKPVEPLDITLSDTARLLIISGPNAGGKSVCLQTVGLLQYMLQCGLLIPVHERSHTGLFDRIFIDIGDEQSIENDLSTYSSHLINMKYFIRNSNENTLLLIDEFGSGTEPLIGGALAEALLERFNRNSSFGVITTHYHNLKQLAEQTQGIINGAMLYDRHLMQPLFKLSIGNPGSSFAIEIARKIGLPEDIIADASQKVGTDYIDTDKYLQDIVRDKRYWENKRQNIRNLEKKLEELTTRYEQDIDAINRQRKEMLTTAKTQASQILTGANAKIEQTIREIKEAQAEKEKTKAIRHSLEAFKQALSNNENGDNQDENVSQNSIQIDHNRQKSIKVDANRSKSIQIDPNRQKSTKVDKNRSKSIQIDQSPPQPPPPFSPGDAVRLKGQQSIGAILTLTGKQAVVAFGMIKSTVKVDRLEKVSNAQIRKEPTKNTFISNQTADSIHEKKLHFKLDIDVRGMRGDEALQAVTYFIDDAIQLSAGRIRILHGTGNGILRQLIRNYLHTIPGVKHFHDEHVQFGGTGITVVDLE